MVIGSGCTHATVLCFSFLIFLRLVIPDVIGKSGVKTGATDLAEENTSLFDYYTITTFV
jgi:hypothetical protein